MAILVTCEACKQTLRVRDEYLDKKAWCPECRAPITLNGERVSNHEVFISYSNKDKNVADAICARLEALPLRCWIAPRDVAAGHSWGSSIIDAIEEAKVMVLVYSGSSNLSPQVIREVERAVSKGLVLVPFRIEATMMSKDMEYFLSASHWIDALTLPVDQHLVELGEIVRTFLLRKAREQEAGEPQKTAPPENPARPSHPPRKRKVWPLAMALGAALSIAGWWLAEESFGKRNVAPQISGERPASQPATKINAPANGLADTVSDNHLNVSDKPADRLVQSGSWMFTTIAGQAGSDGADDGVGSDARFNMSDHRARLALDRLGNLYLTDCGNSAIRKISPEGIVSTLAGLLRNPGSSDGLGADARFRSPHGITVDSAGNIYVADSANDTIRRIAPSGKVSTFAGRLKAEASADGPASVACFKTPVGIAITPDGCLFVTDWGNITIRKITPDGFVSTVAGRAGVNGSMNGFGPSARFRGLSDIAVGPRGTVYISEGGQNTIRQLDPDGMVKTLAGQVGSVGSADGEGAQAQFKNPGGIAVDEAGNLYVADTGNNTIRKISPDGLVTTIGGLAGRSGSKDGIGTDAWFNNPMGIVVDSQGNIYISDDGNNTIRKGQLLKR